MRIICLIFIFSLTLLQGKSQFYSTGTAAGSIKWKQINTPNFQIIYPDGFYDKGNRAANILETVYSEVAKDYSKKPRKISILLYNQSVYSNGYVVWAPRRSEWVTTPPRESYPQGWLEQLAVHEFRHVVQISNLEQGLTKILSFLFGEAAPGAVTAYLPLWFLEGDAVLAETALSSAGRGRDPEFDLEYRAIERDRIHRFSYDQAYLGSYKYNIPNHYKLGYQLTSYGYLKYNTNIWNSTLQQVARSPFIAPFHRGLKNAGAGSKPLLYHNTFDSLKTLWNKNIVTVNSTKSIRINTDYNNAYTNYQYVQATKHGYFAVKTSIDDITRFVWLHNSREEIFYTPGNYHNSRVQATDNYIIWEEYVADLRWEQQSTIDIKILDLNSGRVNILASRKRYFSPHLSPDESSAVCIEIDAANKYSLVILELPSGEVLKKIPLENVIQAFDPVWLNKDQLAYITLTAQGKQIVSYSLKTDLQQQLFDGGFKNIGSLVPGDNSLYFTYDQEAVRNVYQLNLKEASVARITNEQHGADYLSFNAQDSTLYFSSYTVNGYLPAKLHVAEANRVPLSNVSQYMYPWAEELSRTADFNLQKTDIPGESYSEENYNRLLHTFNIHSWAPFLNIQNIAVNTVDPADFVNELLQLGISIYSQNKLSTVEGSLNYFYSKGEHFIEPKVIFRRFYPIIELDMRFSNKQANIIYWPDSLALPAHHAAYRNIGISSYIPLTLTRNKWQRRLQPEVSLRYFHRYFHTREQPGLGYGYLEYSFYGYNLLKQSKRDLQPSFGQTLYLLYNHPLSHAEFFSSVRAGSFTQYLPGLFRHHGLYLNFTFEEYEEGKAAILSNRISLPRGFDKYSAYTLTNYKAIQEYRMPLFYPDLSVGPIAYIKRFDLSIHHDIAKARYFKPEANNTYTLNNEWLNSWGIILGSEVHFLRFFMPVTLRFRTSFLPKLQEFDYGFAFSVDTSF